MNIDKQPIPEDFFDPSITRGGYTAKLKALDVNEMFLVDDGEQIRYFQLAKNINIAIKTKKMPDGRIAIGRVA